MKMEEWSKFNIFMLCCGMFLVGMAAGGAFSHKYVELYETPEPQEVSCECQVPECNVEVIQKTINHTTYRTNTQKHYYTETAFGEIMGVASSIRPYLLDEYDCTEMAEVTEYLFEASGYRDIFVDDIQTTVDCDKVNPDTGKTYFEPVSCNKYNGRHRIVRLKQVFIEPTNGRIIMPADYDRYGIA